MHVGIFLFCLTCIIVGFLLGRKSLLLVKNHPKIIEIKIPEEKDIPLSEKVKVFKDVSISEEERKKVFLLIIKDTDLDEKILLNVMQNQNFNKMNEETKDVGLTKLTHLMHKILKDQES